MLKRITAAIITYNGEKLLTEGLSAIRSQSYPIHEIILVDNNSTDRSVDLVKEKFPEVKILQMKENRGPSPARNAAIKKADTRYVLLVDDDAVLAPDCLRNLMDAVNKFPDAAVWSPRIMYYNDKNIIQFDGVSLYYVGEAILNNPDTSIKEACGKEPFFIDIAGGVAYIVDREKALQIGLFDEDYFFGKTDGEFTFRLTISGFKCLSVPEAIVYHKVKTRGLSKAFYQVRNRWYLILQTYSFRTLFLITPALVVYEISVLVFLTLKGALSEYLKGNLAVIKNFGKLMKKRQKVQLLKKVSDREVLHAGKVNIRKDLLDNKYISIAKEFLNRFFNSYWQLVKESL